MTINPISQEQRNLLIHSFTVEERGTIIFAEKKNDCFILNKHTFDTCEGDTCGTIGAKVNLYSWVNGKSATLVDVVGRRIITNSKKAKQMEFKDDLRVEFITLKKSWVHYIEDFTPKPLEEERQQCIIL